MRRVLMTPTFAVGLGVVIAVALASSASQVIQFTPYKGTPCPITGCTSDTPGTLASARPGTQLQSPAGGQQAVKPGFRASQPARDLVVTYSTLRQDSRGFVGMIRLTSRSGQPLRGWLFRFSYPAARILAVGGGTSASHGPHLATVISRQAAHRWGGIRDAIITFIVTGPPRPPASCTVNGRPCRYRVGRRF